MKEPYINHMFPGVRRPWPSDFEAQTKFVKIYSDSEKYWGDRESYCDYCGNEGCDEKCEEAIECALEDAETEEEREAIRNPPPQLENLNLQDLINMIPAGVSPSDVKLSIWSDESGGQISYGFTVGYSKFFPADPEGLKKAQEKYAECEAAYVVEKQKYDEFVKNQKIKELEANLKALKKK